MTTRLRLNPVERPWGGRGVPTLGLTAPAGVAIGEWWVDAPGFPLQVKVIDTAAPLSVQLHPDDAAARTLGRRGGKTECWIVLSAQPGAWVRVGLRPSVSSDRFFADAEAGADVSVHLSELRVAAGDAVFVPPGTLHTIGAGITLLEVQEPEDVTLRVFDWNREPRRELHLDAARRAFRSEARAGRVAPRAVTPEERLAPRHDVVVECDRFSVERVEAELEFHVAPRRRETWFCANGRVTVGGRPDDRFEAGAAFSLGPATRVRFAPEPRAVLYRILAP